MNERDPAIQQARALERIGDVAGARAAVGRLVASTDGAPPWFLLKWLARLDIAAGNTLRALTALAIIRKTEPADRAFLAHAEMVVACIHAADLDAAASLLGELDGGHGLPNDLDGTLRYVRALALGGPRAPVLRITLLRLYAMVWSHRGRLSAAAGCASEALAQATTLARGARIADIALDLADLLLAAGDLAGARAADARIASAALDDEVASRWARHRVQRELLGGRLAEARAHADRLAAFPEPVSLDARVARALALAELEATFNQFSNAERIARRVLDQLGATQPYQRDRVKTFLQLNACRASSTHDEIELPFLPEQVFDASDGDGPARGHDRTQLAAPAPSLAAPMRWARAANELLLALQRGERELEPRVAAIEAASCDSAYIRAKTAFYVAVARQRSGRLASGEAPFAALAADLEAKSFLPAALQVRRHAGWAAVRAGHIDQHLEHAREIRRLRARMTEGLAVRDKVFFMLNQWSVQDEYISARALAAMRPDRSRRDRRRALFDLYREVTSLTGWHLDEALVPTSEPRPEAPALVATSDIERVIHHQLALAVRRRDRKFRLGSRWSLWAVPRNTMILSFYVLADRVLVFAMSFGSLDARVLLVTRPMLDLAVRELHELIQYRAPQKPTLEALRRVSQLLELPALLGDCHKQRLLIIPHDVLHNVPFSALPCQDDSNVRVCERFQVSYLPDVGWLRRPRQRTTRAFAGVAVGDYAGDEAPLPNAVAEVETACQQLGAQGWRCDLLVDPRPQQVVEALESHSWVHLVCHGVFDRDRPHQSGLLLRAADGSLERLTLDTLARAALAELRLVVLASCWSGETAVLPGHERVCLPAAFLGAGARSVIASLWEVYDENDLLTELYTLAPRVGPAAALTALQCRALRARPGTEYLWASFVLYGAP
jgi:CHAT domain-containing protein